jgi:CheY-like chemotaxis protein
LQERDYEVVAAESAEAVRDRLAEAHPDLIMLDVLMPNEDGWNILQSLKISPRPPPSLS